MPLYLNALPMMHCDPWCFILIMATTGFWVFFFFFF